EYESKEIEIVWTNNSHKIRYKVTFNPLYFNEEKFNSYEYKYYSKDGHSYILVQPESDWQAMSWIDNNEYVLSTNDENTLKSVIDKIAYAE
ncbi:MAG: hypothetical protein IKU19_03215, partial [Clostridia bacterium]|nr:hypothetical protein [Clostridia bacterium]